MTMRISKYFPISGVGIEPHGLLPPSAAPPNPAAVVPTYPWVAGCVNFGSALIFGKFTGTIATEFLADILAGYDWGMGQPHVPIPPCTATPAIALCTLGASHKYWMPSYAVQEAVAGGAIAMAGGGSGPVAISTPAFFISLQDCIDVGGARVGLVAPLGIGIQVASTRWVGFGAADFFAGVIGMAGDAASAVVGGAIGGKLFGNIGSQMGQAVAGAAFGMANSVVQGLMGRATSDSGGARAIMGLAALFSVGGAPAGIGLLSGQVADAVGGPPRPHDSGPRPGVTYGSSSDSGSGS